MPTKKEKLTRSTEADLGNLSIKLSEYKAIFDDIPIGVFLTKDWEILYCNPALSEVLAWPNAILIGQHISVLCPTIDNNDETREATDLALERGELFNIECDVYRHDNSQIRCRIMAKTIDTIEEKDIVIWFVEDIAGHTQGDLQSLLFEHQAILENASVGICF